MFKEMTTKKKIIIGIIVVVVIVCIILFLRSRNKKKKADAANKSEATIQTVSSPVVEKKRSQIVPEQDMQAVKTTPETKLSVEQVIPDKKETVAATAPVNNGNKGPVTTPTTPAPYKSVMGDEFMQNANEG